LLGTRWLLVMLVLLLGGWMLVMSVLLLLGRVLSEVC
jgi:hypothetical protein